MNEKLILRREEVYGTISKQKPVYKIWDKNHKKYLSGYNGRNQWDSLNWCISAAQDRYRNAIARDEIEIHTLQLVVQKRENPKAMILEKKNKQAEKERIANEKKEKREVARSFLEGLVPLTNVNSIVAMYDRGSFNEKLMIRMKEAVEIYKKN